MTFIPSRGIHAAPGHIGAKSIPNQIPPTTIEITVSPVDSLTGSDRAISEPLLASVSTHPRLSLVRQLDSADLKELRRLAKVKPPGLFQRVSNTVGGWITGVRLALAVGPTLGHTILAKELSQLEAAITGGTPLAPLDWLRERRPEAYVKSLGTLLEAASNPAEAALGLSPTDLLTVEQHFYQAMQPVQNENGFKTTAPYLRELAKAPFRKQKDQRAAFVFLGEKLKDEAESVTSLWNSTKRPTTNPFPAEDQRSIIWDRLEVEAKRGQLPVFVDVDGDYSTFTGTEFVAKRTLASLGERNNSLGDGFADPAMYFSWLTARQESTSQSLLPYFEQKDQGLSEQIEGFKAILTPPWLHGEKGLGPWPAVEEVREIPGRVGEIRQTKGEGAWVDVLTALDRDVLTGVQTHWIKLLRELPKSGRQELITTLPQALFSWNLRQPGSSDFDQVSPPDAPLLSEIGGRQDLSRHDRPYDRSVALKDLVDHTLDGLGIAERRQMLTQVKELAGQQLPVLEARESRLQESLGNAYRGLDVAKILDGSLSKTELRKGLKELRDFADKSPRDPVSQEARRHGQMLGFLFEIDSRYGEVDEIMSKLSGDFHKHPFGVSEFFIPPALGAAVTPLLQSEPSSVRLGNPNDPNPLKLSQVFEGGGGRGFAYVECLKQFEEAFTDSSHGYEIDEFVGTSAGSLVAILLAAGCKPSEIREILESIDFSAFNADAVWMMGGVDPKVRGVERNGLFSTQKMYQTFYQVLSDKLGIEGRPILFRDLPHKLKMVTTLVNSDLGAEDDLRDNLDSDGRFTWSTDNTPNVDVVGALIASAAVPGFFQAPQMLMARSGEDGEIQRSRLQLCDGGVVDNLSLSSASSEEVDRALIVLPAHTHTRDPKTGEWIGLDTLNFDTANLDLVDAENRKLYSTFMPQMDEYLQRMKSHGVGRAVLGFNLARPNEQAEPVLAGSSEELSLKGLIHAKEIGLPAMEKDKGDALVRKSQRPPTLLGNVFAGLFDTYVDDRPGDGDGKGDFHRDHDGFRFQPGSVEESDVFEIARAAGGAGLSASQAEYEARRFERETSKDQISSK